MAKLSDMRKQAQVTKDLQEQRAARIKDAVNNVVNSSAFILTVANHEGVDDSAEQREQFANAIVSSVTEAVNDNVLEFKDACRARGIKESVLSEKVDVLIKVFGLAPADASEEEKIKAIADYMHENPKMYEEIKLLM